LVTFYTAGPWKDRDKVRVVAEKLRDEGYRVNSRWLDVPEEAPEGMTYEEYQVQQANHDLHDVVAADALIYVNTGYKSEGKATELGIAIAMLKPIIAIGGKANNIFLNLNIPNFPTIEEAITFLKEQEALEVAQR
jgi:nucleoside 2-deoxyribosyltransferase